MPLLFSYGTLQEESVQLATFGRRLQGQRDALPRYEPSRVKIDDPAIVAALARTHHANAAFNGNDRSRVEGTVFEVTDAELALGDRFEAQYAYERVSVVLASGKQAWVYVSASSDRT